MSSIAGILPDLDATSEKFVVEALSDALDPAWIEEALRRSGRESQRERLLPARLALWTVVLLCLFRRHSYVSLLGLLAESLWARRHWPSGVPPTSSALVQARDRLGPEPARTLFERSADAWRSQSGGLLVAGHRVLTMDGSTARTPDSAPNRAAFGLPPSSRGRAAYPMMRLVTLLDVGSRLTLGVRSGPYRSGEITLAHGLLDAVPAGSLLVLDRNFTSYEFLLDLHLKRGAHFIVRVKRTMKARTLRRLGPGDRLVQVRFHNSLRHFRPDLPATWVLREVTYCPREGHEAVRVFTTLLDPALLPAEEVAQAYGLRWEHETALDEAKTHLLDRTTVDRAVLFRSMTPRRVEQELYAIFIAHNLVRVLLLRAGARAGRCPRRLGFTVALDRVREAVRDMMALATPRLPERYGRLLAALGRVVVPKRPGRASPREVKIKMSQYPCKQTRTCAA